MVAANLDVHEVTEACTTSISKPFVTTDVIGLEMCGVGNDRTGREHSPWCATVRLPRSHDRARGLAELTALGVAAGADPKTFFGLAGVGDLIATWRLFAVS